jgi:prepilin-type N-terminal cleavage/methylation domain-containing protein
MSTIDRLCRARRGFTLLEALAASVVLSILVLGVCGTLTESYEQSAVVQSNGTGVALARQLADEITSRQLGSSLGPGSYTSRAQYTTVCNYNGYSDTSTAIPLLEGGTPLNATKPDTYSRSVTVSLGARPSIDSTSPSTDFAIVTVSVTGPWGQTVTIPKFVCNYAIQR